MKSGSLVSYLLGTGLARVVVRGTYLNVVTATTRLLPGDVIAYFEKGAIQHLAVVTGTDPRGYTLVNSHTADRYRVPWDIGWDRNTGYILLHLRDSASVQAPARYLMPESMPVVRTGCTSPLPAVG